MRQALLIHDLNESGEVLAALLSDNGWAVARAPKDVRIARALGSRLPDLVVVDVAGPLDVALPFLRALRAPSGGLTKILVLATDLEAEDARAARLLGVACCLRKPLTRRALTMAIASLRPSEAQASRKG